MKAARCGREREVSRFSRALHAGDPDVTGRQPVTPLRQQAKFVVGTVEFSLVIRLPSAGKRTTRRFDQI
jgi:hypothetical protein